MKHSDNPGLRRSGKEIRDDGDINMGELKTAGEIMIPLEKYPHIPYWFSIRQAMAEIAHSTLEINGRRSLPRYVLVFDEKYRLMGMVRRRDLLRGLEPEFLLNKSVEQRWDMFSPKQDRTEYTAFVDRVIEATIDRSNRPVNEIMRPVDRIADYNDNIFQIIYDMNINSISMLPVSKDGNIVGVVRTVDVFYEVCKFVL